MKTIFDNRKMFYRCKASLILDNIYNSKEDCLKIIKDKINKILIENGAYWEDTHKSILHIGYYNQYLLDEISKIVNITFDEYLKRNQPYLTSSQIARLLEDGFHFGAHSLDHPPYNKIPFAEQIRQTRESLRYLKERFRIQHSFFAFPFTDVGLSDCFFNETKKDVDLTFGTGGFGKKTRFNNFQRIPMELTHMKMKNIIKLFYLKHQK